MIETMLKRLDHGITESIKFKRMAEVCIESEKVDLDKLTDTLQATYNCFVDYNENKDGTFSVWGWTDSSKKNPTDWRIKLTFDPLGHLHKF